MCSLVKDTAQLAMVGAMRLRAPTIVIVDFVFVDVKISTRETPPRKTFA